MKPFRNRNDHFWSVGVALVLAALLATKGAAQLGVKRPPLTQVVTSVHRTHLHEIRLGELAKQKGTTPEIRAYGDRLMRDHRLADGMLIDLADEMKVAVSNEDVAPHEKMDSLRHQELITELGKLPTDQFDGEFLKLIKGENEEALQTLTDAVGNLPVSDVRNHIVRMRPILAQHLDLTFTLLGRKAE